jgi:hypothetical protein
VALYTSNFKLSGRNPLAVAISNGQRGYEKVRKYKPLVPPWTLVKDCRAGVVSDTDFNLEYMRQLRGLDPRQVMEELLNGQEDAIMLCWEAPGEYCHRRLAAHWLEGELGILVPELDVTRVAVMLPPAPQQEELFTGAAKKKQ